MVIRPATAEDIPAVMALGAEMIAESPEFSRFTPNLRKQTAIFKGSVANPYIFFWVVDDLSGFMLGHLEVQPWFDERIAVEDVFFIRPEARKTRRAVALLRMFESWAADHGAFEVKLGVSTGVAVEATARFYQKMGYTIVGPMTRKEL